MKTESGRIKFAGHNPRYVAFARLHGRNTDEQLAYDREAWKGGCMTGFILFISKMVRAFREHSPHCFVGPNISERGQDAFTKFIDDVVDRETENGKKPADNEVIEELTGKSPNDS